MITASDWEEHVSSRPTTVTMGKVLYKNFILELGLVLLNLRKTYILYMDSSFISDD